MKTRARKAFAGIGIVAGAALVAFEVARFRESGPVERWFWLVVGLVVAALGVVQLLTRPTGRGD